VISSDVISKLYYSIYFITIATVELFYIGQEVREVLKSLELNSEMELKISFYKILQRRKVYTGFTVI